MSERVFETMNMKSVTIERFTSLIQEQMEDGDLTPMMGIGKSGIGKTESIFGLTKKLGIGFCELRLVTMTETDLLGIPTIENGRTTWASNELLPMVSRDGERGILVLDEITSATSTIRAAAYQLLDSKRALGNYKLPDGWLVVALGNGADDGGQYSGMEAAFLNRCRCLRVEPDLRTWKKWAVPSGVNPSVIAFLTFMPEELHNFDPDANVGMFPSPRAWVGLSKKLNDREKKNDNKPLDAESIDIYAACSVGELVAPKFSAFYSYNKSTISAEDILSGKASTDVPKYEKQVMYIVIQNLASQVSKELELGCSGFDDFKPEVLTRVSNACRWIAGVGNKSLDMAITAVNELVTNVPKFSLVMLDDSFGDMCPEFDDFATSNCAVYKRK